MQRKPNPGFPQAARRHDHPGAAAQVQARQYGRAAALHRALAAVPSDPMAADASIQPGAGSVGSALRADLALQLEPTELSEADIGSSIRLPGSCCSSLVPGARWGEPSVFPPCWNDAPLWSLLQRISSSRF